MKRIILIISVLLLVVTTMVVQYPDNPVIGLSQNSALERGAQQVPESGGTSVDHNALPSDPDSLVQADEGQIKGKDVVDEGKKTKAQSNKEKTSKYDDYKFDFTTGRAFSGPPSETGKNKDIWPSDIELGKIFENFYRIQNEYPMGMSPRIQISENFYVGGGHISSTLAEKAEAAGDKIPLKEKLLNCDWPNEKQFEGQECSWGNFVGIFDIEKQTVTRIRDRVYNPAKQSWDQRRMGYWPLDGVVDNKEVYYGCYPSYSFSVTDLNLDSMNEVMMLSRSGFDDKFIEHVANPEPPEQADAGLHLSFLLPIQPDPFLFDIELVHNEYDYKKSKGERRYAKLFFGDFDKDKKLDILVWRRFFNVVPEKNNYWGKNEFVKEGFEHYEEASPAYERQAISNEEGQKLLKEHNWGWFDGFPSKNLCIAKDPWRHHAKPEIMQHGSIPTD